MSRVEIVIPILKNCLVGNDIFRWHILFLEFKTVSLKLSRKYNVLERGFSNRLEMKATSFSLLERKSKVGNLYSCRCGCKSRESKRDKAFTQLNIINILCKQKHKSRQMNILERHVKLRANSWHS